MEQNRQPKTKPEKSRPKETISIQGATVHLRYSAAGAEPECMASIKQLLIDSLSS